MKIEKGIPAPRASEINRMNREQAFAFYEQMEVGDSVLIENASHITREVTYARMYFPQNGKKYVSKKIGKDIRIWRTA